jgi:predicted nucleic acid-binding protein
MKTVVVDTSVVLAFYLPAEPLKAQALNLLAEYATGRVKFATTTLTMYEILNVLSRCVRGVKSGQSMQFDQALAVHAAITNLAIEEYPVGPLAERILDLTVRHARSAYDAAYVALAEHLGVELVTADERLFNALVELQPAVRFLGQLDPGDHGSG